MKRILRRLWQAITTRLLGRVYSSGIDITDEYTTSIHGYWDRNGIYHITAEYQVPNGGSR